VSWLVTVTSALVTRAPVGSVTVPLRVARPVCAESWSECSEKRSRAQTASGE
jgi:hypothetical protein